MSGIIQAIINSLLDIYTGKGNGTPLQWGMDGGAW